jgi:hypothetical protein
MKDLYDGVVEEFQYYQDLVQQDESVDYDILTGEEFKAREAETFLEVVPEEVRHHEALVESIPLKFLKFK